MAISDAAWWKGDPARTPAPRFSESTRTSQYVPMRDGTRLAIHTFLPTGLPAEEKVPTIMIITPYFSAMEYRSALAGKIVSKLSMVGGLEWAEAFNRYGYAVALMDLRGSGTSFGVKDTLMAPGLKIDGPDVIDWIVAQPWSNGLVGATGISAVGMTANWLATAKHPALRAIAPRFTTFDIFASTHPSGLVPARFIGDIGELLRAMDTNRLHQMPEKAVARVVMRGLIKGLLPVDDDPDRQLLAAAAVEHEGNAHYDEDLVSVTYRDDPLPSEPTAIVDSQSPATFASDLEASGVPIYCFAGWLDGYFIKDMLAEHNTVRTPGSRIVIGPWGHGGRWYSSPLVDKKRATDFDHVAELVRFFDMYLRDRDLGVSTDATINYFTMGEEKWKTTDRWPLANTTTLRRYLAPDGRLAESPGADTIADRYVVDPDVGTGVHSRMGKHLGGGRFPAAFPDRRRRDEKLLTYTSDPLTTDVEVTGHPLITLHVAADTTDAAVYVYLEDVDQDGGVRYVTDGALRASWRKQGEAPYWTAWPYFPGRRADVEPLTPGEVAVLAFDLYPTSYLFRAGHRMRVAIAGADKDNFVHVPEGQNPVLSVCHGGAQASFIELPVVPRSR